MSFYGNIDPDNLIGLVRNTAPFIFSDEYKKTESISEIFEKYSDLGWLYILNSYDENALQFSEQTRSIKWYEYFLLCLSAHYATVMTFVPTDVDNKIRLKMWYEMDKRSVTEKMLSAVFRLSKWDVSKVSNRTAHDKEYGNISGHDGEYLTILGGALGSCLMHEWSDLAELIEKKIADELKRENEILKKYLVKSIDEIVLLKVCAIVTHNVGDLMRAIGMWHHNLMVTNQYKEKYSKIVGGKNPYGLLFHEAGIIYKEFLVHDNGRHLALREPKILRISEDFLLPVGPFFEEWGEKIGRNPVVKEADMIEIINALLDGAERLPLQKGYTRALVGLNRSLPKGLREFEKKLQKQGVKTLKGLKIEEETKISSESYLQRLSKKVRMYIEQKNLLKTSK